MGQSLEKLQVGSMLPDVALPSGSSQVPLRSGNETSVLFRSHAGSCGPCAAFIEELRGLEDEFRIWEARLVVVTQAAAEGLPLDEADLLVADRYGQVFYFAQGGKQHNFPTNRELTEWLKHLGTLCPE